MTIVVHRRAPNLPEIPAEIQGQLVVAVVACYIGAAQEAERILGPLRAHRRPLLDLCHPKPYVEHQAMFDASFPPGWWYYMRSCDVAELTDEVIDLTLEHAARIVSAHTAFPIWQRGGASARVAENATAVPGRGAGFTFNVTAATQTEAGFPEERDWVRRFWADLEPHGTGAYVNFLMDEGQHRVHQAYGQEALTRLRALKRHRDPDNLLRLN